MNLLRPIYTEKRECQDCYKCLRNCPVKAIKVENGCATVISELCVLCGRCVSVCPTQAKRVRDDLSRARHLLSLRKRVLVSLAPSYTSELTGGTPGQLIHALKQLGFWGVSETALGAQQVSAHVAALLAEKPTRPLLSTACPTAVGLLQKYFPEQAELLTPLPSPVLAHAALLRKVLGEDVAVVFVGPCIAKKSEADRHPELLDVVLTFSELRRWFEQAGIDWTHAPEGPEDHFVPERAAEGALYPVDGGMIAGIRAGVGVHDAAFMAFSGVENIERGLRGIETLRPDRGLFVELLACEGGCVSGPEAHSELGTACKRYQVLSAASYPADQVPRQAALELRTALTPGPALPLVHAEAEVRAALRSVGKESREDERNCAGCGYETCRAFAHALLEKKAEKAMCVTYMRQMALKKANALLRTMPSAVVIADQDLALVECNEPFVRMFAPDLPEITPQRLEGLNLKHLVPFAHLFQSVLKTGEDILDTEVRHGAAILHGSLFTVEKGRTVGGVFQDVTRPHVQKEQIVRKASEVIQKNLATVQQIAYLLGENAAESEITLQSIIESFTPHTEEPAPQPGPAPRSGAEPRHERDDEPWKRPYRG